MGFEVGFFPGWPGQAAAPRLRKKKEVRRRNDSGGSDDDDGDEDGGFEFETLEMHHTSRQFLVDALATLPWWRGGAGSDDCLREGRWADPRT